MRTVLGGADLTIKSVPSRTVSVFPAFLILLLFPSFVFAAPVIKVISGKIEKVTAEKQELTLSYPHPVTGKNEKLIFRVDSATGFGEGIRLQDLREGQMVSVDYTEETAQLPRAVQVKRVPLRGIPREVRSFFS